MGMIPNKRLYGTATVGAKGQIVIPAEAREELNIQQGDKLYIVNAMHGAGIVCLREEMLEDVLQQLTAQMEGFRALRDKSVKGE